MRVPRSNESAVRTLLIVGDGAESAERLARTVHRMFGGDAQVAHNTEEAMNLLSARRWDVVLWHIGGSILPGMSGLREILSRQPAAAVLVVTAPDDLPIAARAVEAGASGYLLLGPHAETTLEPLLTSALATVSLRDTLARAEQRADLLASRLRLLGELSHDAMFIISPTGGVLWTNASAEKLLGRPASQILGTNASVLFRPANLLQRLLDVLSGKAEAAEIAELGGVALVSHDRPILIGVEGFLRQTPGSFLLVNLSAGPLLDNQGHLLEVVLVASPISHEEFLSRELAYANRHLDALLNLVSEAVAFVDNEGVISKVNGRFAELVGAGDAAECVGQSAGALLGDPHIVRSVLTACLSAPGEHSASLGLHGYDGGRRQATVRGAAVRDQEDTILGVLLIVEAQHPAGLEEEMRPSIEARLLLRCLEAARSAHDRHDARKVLEILLDMAMASTPADGAAIFVGSDDEALVAHQNISLGVARQLGRLTAAKLPARDASSPLKPTVVSDIETYLHHAPDKQLAEALFAEGLRSGVFLPLEVGDQPLGVLFLAAARAGAFDRYHPDELTVLAAESSCIVQNLLAQMSVSTHATNFAEMTRLSLELARASDVTAILTAAATTAVGLFAAKWAAVHVVDARRQELELAVRADAEGDVSPRATMPPAAHEAARQAIEGLRTVVRTTEMEGQLQTLAAAGLRADGEAVGAIVVAWDAQRRPSQDQLQILETVAHMVGLSVIRARALEEETSRSSQIRATAAEALELEARARSLLQAAATVEELTELDEILSSLAQAGLRIIGLEQIAIYLADYEKSELAGAVLANEPEVVRPLTEKWPLQKGASVYADAALCENPYLVAAVESRSGAYEAALIPLRTHSTLVGLLVGANPKSGRELSPQDLRLLRALGSLASVAIDRARVDQMRDMMARSVSHELRAPLASARAYVEVVLDEGVGPINQEQRVFLQRAANACEYLQRLVEDLLDLSRLRAGQISLHPTVTDLRELIDQILDSLRVRIDENEVEVQVSVAPEVAQLLVDRTRLAQIITNLVDNAVKFNYHGGRVTISATLHDNDVVIAVSDTGPGIPESEREAIFQEFYRGKGELAQTRSGAGLGLSIARRVAAFLGGTITVESQVGQGSTFFLRFPYRPPDSFDATNEDPEVTHFGSGERVESSDRGR